MNEVRATQVTNVTPAVPQVASAVSAKGKAEADALPSSGKELPITPSDVVLSDEVVKTKEASIEEAVTEINDYVQSVQRDLHFSIDEDSGITVVRVRDKESGDLIRQIPEDIFLSLAHKLKENQSINLFDAHG